MHARGASVWVWPIGLGLLTASGLLSALISDALGDVWSWIALGAPVIVMVRFGFRRSAPSGRGDPVPFSSNQE